MMIPRVAGLAVIVGLVLPSAASALPMPAQAPDMSDTIRIGGG